MIDVLSVREDCMGWTLYCLECSKKYGKEVKVDVFYDGLYHESKWRRIWLFENTHGECGLSDDVKRALNVFKQPNRFKGDLSN